MRKKYRIKVETGTVMVPVGWNGLCEAVDYACYIVQVRKWWGWSEVKAFADNDDPGFSRREAEELLDKLNER